MLFLNVLSFLIQKNKTFTKKSLNTEFPLIPLVHYLIFLLQVGSSSKCRTGLHLVNSTTKRLDTGVKELHAINSYINDIDLVDQQGFSLVNCSLNNIFKLEMHSSTGNIFNSEIDTITSLHTSEGLIVFNSKIRNIRHVRYLRSNLRIMTLKGRSVIFSNTTIGLIETDGMFIQTRMAFMRNVILKRLLVKSITVDKDNILHMENVTIESAEENCIFSQFPENLIIKNVTVNGEALKHNSTWIMSESKKFLPSEDDILVSEDDLDHCVLNTNILDCNYYGVHKVSSIALFYLSIVLINLFFLSV